jgi:hypothetical protein
MSSDNRRLRDCTSASSVTSRTAELARAVSKRRILCLTAMQSWCTDGEVGAALDASGFDLSQGSPIHLYLGGLNCLR